MTWLMRVITFPYMVWTTEVFVERRSIALRAATANALAIIIGTFMGNPGFGVMAYFGTIIIQMGEGRAHRYRLIMQSIGLACVYGLVALGYMASVSQPVQLFVLVLVAFVAVLIMQVLKVGPPGALYMMLSAGMGMLSAQRGLPMLVLYEAIALGAALSFGLTALDTLINRHKPERMAIAKAEQAVAKLEAHDTVTDTHTATELLDDATQALLDAWSSLMEADLIYRPQMPETSHAGIHLEDDSKIKQKYRDRRKHAPEDFEAQLRAIHHRFVVESAYLTAHEYAMRRSPGFAFGGIHTIEHNIPLEPTDIRGRVLGKPTVVSAFEDALRWPSEPLLIAGRSVIGALITAALCTIAGVQRVDWAMAFTVMLLNMGGTRQERYVKTFQRAAIAWLGIGGAIVLINLPFNPYILAAEIFILRYIFVTLSARYYNFSAVFMSLIATISIGISVLGFDVAQLSKLATERAIESNFAILSVFITVTFAFRRSDELFIRGYAYRTLHAIGQVIDDVIANRVHSLYAMMNRRRLYFALLVGEKVAKRAVADDQTRAGRYRETTKLLRELGYYVVGASLHPLMTVDKRPFEQCGALLTGLLSQPFNEPRPPTHIEAMLNEAMDALRHGDHPEAVPE